MTAHSDVNDFNPVKASWPINVMLFFDKSILFNLFSDENILFGNSSM